MDLHRGKGQLLALASDRVLEARLAQGRRTAGAQMPEWAAISAEQRKPNGDQNVSTRAAASAVNVVWPRNWWQNSPTCPVAITQMPLDGRGRNWASLNMPGELYL